MLERNLVPNAATRLTRLAALALASALFGASFAAAQSATQPMGEPAKDDLPKGEAVLDRYIEATGGRAAYEKLRNRVSTGRLEAPAQGLKGAATIFQAAPDLTYSVIEIESIGKIEEGSDGKLAWSRSALLGPQLKEGEEAEMALRQALFNAELNWRKIYEKAENKGVEKIDGVECFRVELTAKGGDVETHFFDKASGLRVRLDLTVKTFMGAMPVQTTFGDHRRVDGVLVPHATRMKTLGQEQVVTLDKVEHNVSLPKDRFTPPDEIRALAKAKAGEKEKAAENEKVKEGGAKP